MMPLIAYKLIPAADFASEINAAWSALVPQTEDCSAWLEAPLNPRGLALRDRDVSLTEAGGLLNDWPDGRLFGPIGELRWERTGDTTVHLVLTSDIGAAGFPAGYDGALTLVVIEPVEGIGLQGGAAAPESPQVLLWGHKGSRGWSEERIPELRYPATWPGPYAAVIVRSYEHQADPARPYDSQIVRYLGYNGAIDA
jgi:hypothetical protein